MIRDLIKDHAGLYFDNDTSYLLQRRLQERLAALGLTSFAAYHRHLTNQCRTPEQRQQELDELFDRVATKETYFFREDYQLRAFRTEVLPRIHGESPRGPLLRVWSAGCSTGEEPYTLAIEILESGLFDRWEVNIVGSDLSHSALSTARAGTYGTSSFRQTDPKMIKRYFHDTADRWQVIGQVKQMVSFQQLNLNQPDWSELGDRFDVIFCRNVLIYFDRAHRAKVVQRFERHLIPGGYLLLGHSESLLDSPAPFELHHLKRDLIYRKPKPTA